MATTRFLPKPYKVAGPRLLGFSTVCHFSSRVAKCCTSGQCGKLLQDLEPGSWQQSSLDKGASMIIPVPSPFGGVVIVGSTSLCYFSPDPAQQPLSAVKLQQAIIHVSPPVSPVIVLLKMLCSYRNQDCPGVCPCVFGSDCPSIEPAAILHILVAISDVQAVFKSIPCLIMEFMMRHHSILFTGDRSCTFCAAHAARESRQCHAKQA